MMGNSVLKGIFWALWLLFAGLLFTGTILSAYLFTEPYELLLAVTILIIITTVLIILAAGGLWFWYGRIREWEDPDWYSNPSIR